MNQYENNLPNLLSDIIPEEKNHLKTHIQKIRKIQMRMNLVKSFYTFHRVLNYVGY